MPVLKNVLGSFVIYGRYILCALILLYFNYFKLFIGLINK